MGDKYNIKSKVQKFNEQDIDVREKFRITRLCNMYKMLQGENYSLMEDELYSPCKDDSNKIRFELNRILIFINNKSASFQIMVKYIEIVKMVEKANFDSISDVREIYANIIELELDLGMEIGLYKEAFNYFFDKLNGKRDYHNGYGFDIDIDDGDSQYTIEVTSWRNK